MEPLRRRRPSGELRARRHAGQSGCPATGHPYLHGVEAALGHPAAGHPRDARVLRPREILATGESRAQEGAPRAQMSCELCTPADVVAENPLAYVRYDSNSLSRGHVLVVPRRHVADFFAMTAEEQSSILELLNEAQRKIQREQAPDGYNIGVNIGKA